MNSNARNSSSRKRRSYAWLITIMFAAFMIGCARLTAATETVPVPTTAAPTLTSTALPPSSTPLPSDTPTPKPTATPACDLSETLGVLKQAVSVDEFAIHQNEIRGTSSLVVWFVEPGLDPEAGPGELEEVVDRARSRAIEVSHMLRISTPCSEILFDVINPIVVDRDYVGWFSGQIEPEDLPTSATIPSDELSGVVSAMTVGFERTSPVQDFTPGTCTWNETRQRLQSHFSPDRQNVAFYFVVDDNGPNIWAQWDGPADPMILSLNLGNIMLESECFSPKANIFIIVVDEAGVAQFVGLVPEMQVDNLRVLFSQ